MATIGQYGIEIETLENIFSDLQTAYKDIYGQDINLDQDTTDGQMIAIFSKLKRDIDENMVSIYNAFDPDTAEGVQLNRLLKLCGINRSAATKSSVDIEITTDRSLTLPSDYTVSDSLDQNWIITDNQTLPIGTTTVSFRAEEWGAVEALANTITEAVTIVLGVTNINNPLDANVGLDEQTDTELKLQRKQSVSLPSENTVEGLQAKLLNIQGVSDAIVKENDTLIYDVTLDLNGKTIWAIVDGGAIEDIGEVLSVDRGSGVALKGSETYTYQKNQIRQDGSIRVYSDVVAFDRPTETDIYIKFDIKLRAGAVSYDLEAIKDELITKTYYIGENATVTELYSFIYAAGNTFIAENLQLSDDNITYVSDSLLADIDEKFVITKANIIITEV